MTRRTVLLAPVVVVAVAAAAFTGYGAWSRSGEVEFVRGGVAFSGGGGLPAPVPSAASASPSARPTTPVASPTSRPTARATALAQPEVAPARTALPRSPAPAAPRSNAAVRTASTAPVAAVRTPAVGAYGLRVTGSESVRFGPVSFCTRDFPRTSSWIVARAQGEGSDAYVVDHRLFPAAPGQHDERHLYRYDRDRVLLTFEQATVTCAGQRQSSDVSFSPAQLRIDGPLRTGATWTAKGGDADRTETARSEVLRAERLTVSGRAVDTWVVQTSVDISGSESGRREQRWWWAPSLGLPLRLTESITASRSGGEYRSTLDSTVTSLPANA